MLASSNNQSTSMSSFDAISIPNFYRHFEILFLLFLSFLFSYECWRLVVVIRSKQLHFLIGTCSFVLEKISHQTKAFLYALSLRNTAEAFSSRDRYNSGKYDELPRQLQIFVFCSVFCSPFRMILFREQFVNISLLNKLARKNKSLIITATPFL